MGKIKEPNRKKLEELVELSYKAYLNGYAFSIWNYHEGQNPQQVHIRLSSKALEAMDYWVGKDKRIVSRAAFVEFAVRSAVAALEYAEHTDDPRVINIVTEEILAEYKAKSEAYDWALSSLRELKKELKLCERSGEQEQLVNAVRSYLLHPDRDIVKQAEDIVANYEW